MASCNVMHTYAMTKSILNSATPRADLLCTDNGRSAIERRLGEIDAPHVAPLNAWVRSIRERGVLTPESAATIPWFDPHSAGVNAKVLLLLQDPSGTASATQFISPDNNDPTARYTAEACNEAGLARDVRLHWNVFPWWVNVPGGSKTKAGSVPDPTRPPETWPAARTKAAKLTGELIALLPQLRVIVVLGVQAQNGYKAVEKAGLELPQDVEVMHGLSLSPPGFHSHRAEVINVLRNAARIA